MQTRPFLEYFILIGPYSLDKMFNSAQVGLAQQKHKV